MRGKMRRQITLFQDQYELYKELKSTNLLVAFVEFMFEDKQPKNSLLNSLETAIFNSFIDRMEKSKKIYDRNSKWWQSSHWWWRPETPVEKPTEKTAKEQPKEQPKNKEEEVEEEVYKENVKRKFLEYVYLTDKEYGKLIDTYWEKVIKNYIERLNNRIWENPNEKKRKKKSHYYTLCKRINDAWISKIPPKPLENETWIYDLPF